VVEVDLLEEGGDLLGGGGEAYVAEGVVEGDAEFVFVHDSLCAAGVGFGFLVQALDGHFAKVLLDAEVGEFGVGDILIAIDVISEDIPGDVCQLKLILFEEVDECVMDFGFVEFLIVVLVEFDEKVPDTFADDIGETVVGEVELYFLLHFLGVGEDTEDGLDFEDIVVSFILIILF
jgi:hypothetical protein